MRSRDFFTVYCELVAWCLVVLAVFLLLACLKMAKGMAKDAVGVCRVFVIEKTSCFGFIHRWPA